MKRSHKKEEFLKVIVNRVEGRGLPLPGNDIDTDRIIPAQFMKCVTFDKLGKYVFYDSRFNADGSKKKHPFNDAKYKGAAVLIAGRNFGCGSSREHAPQSLMRFGIKAIVGESFAEIFAGNCTALGIPAVTATKEDIDRLMKCARSRPGQKILVDLELEAVTYGNGSFRISMPKQYRTALLDGTWDSTAELLSAVKEIKKTAKTIPYMNNFQSGQ